MEGKIGSLDSWTRFQLKVEGKFASFTRLNTAELGFNLISRLGHGRRLKDKGFARGVSGPHNELKTLEAYWQI